MLKIAIVGLGNIGQAALQAVGQAKDMQLGSVVTSKTLEGIPTVRSINELQDIDVAVLCSPSRAVPELAAALLAKGICTVDSYDLHPSIVALRSRLDAVAKEHHCASITAAGWDPGSDSVIRTLAEAMMPKGITYTNFGPGMSMGHTVAAKSKDGVKEALSMTIPLGTGIHRRMVYIELEPGADFGQVSKAIKEDAYFAKDETHVIQVESVEMLKDVGHGVHLIRQGVSGMTGNQRVEFSMRIHNPALTGQILVSAARAVVKQAPGCYTMIEIPPIHFLEGETEALIKRLV